TDVVEDLAHALRGVHGPVEIRRVELDDLISHLADSRDGAGEILRELSAHRIQLETDWHGPRASERGRRREGDRRRRGEKHASRDRVHGGGVYQAEASPRHALTISTIPSDGSSPCCQSTGEPASRSSCPTRA